MKKITLLLLLLSSCSVNRDLPKREPHILAGLESLPFENYFEVEKMFIIENLEREGIPTQDLFFVYMIDRNYNDYLCNLQGTITGTELVNVTNGFKGIVSAYVFDSEMNYAFRVDRHQILRHPVPLRAIEVQMVDKAIKNDFFVFLKIANCSSHVIHGYNGKLVKVFHVVDEKFLPY